MTAQSSTFLQSALSADGSLSAVVIPSSSNRLLVQIYQVSASSCSLQLTLTHTSKEGSIERVAFLNSSSLVGLIGSKEIVVWDLSRGVVSEKIVPSDDQQFLDVAVVVDSEEPQIYALTANQQKLYVYEYNGAKLARKIKSGRLEDGGASVAVSSKHVIVRTSQGMRVMSRETGQKVAKLKVTGSEKNAMIICPTDPNVLVAIKDSGAAVLYSIDTCKALCEIPQDNVSSSTSLQVVKEDSSLSYSLLVNDRLYSVEEKSHELLTRLSSKHQSSLFLYKSKLLSIVHPKSGGPQSQWYELDDSDLASNIQLGESPEGKTDTPKRKAAIQTAEPTILGPGQAGSEAAPPTKKTKKAGEDNNMEVDDNDDESDEEDGDEKGISIAERLQQLTDTLEHEDDDDDDDDDEGRVDASGSSFKPSKATTESLKEFLTQAVQSDDDALLELALAVRDVKVISQTLKEIDSALVVVLLGKITARLASTPLRAESLAVWLSYCLKTGRFQSHELASLRNLLHERIESFPDLLRLEGRLSMMCE
jgi:hypothetical protein